MINFNSPELTFSIKFSSPLDGEEWLNNCYISVNASSFSGNFQCNIHMSDIVEFYKQIQIMHEQSLVSRKQTIVASLDSMEGDIHIVFEMDVLGKIHGKYRLGNPMRAVLSGVFAIDQSYLAPLLADLKSALNLMNPKSGRH